MIENLKIRRVATSPVLTVHTAREETAYTPVFRTHPFNLQHQGTRLPFDATAFRGTGTPADGLPAAGIDVQAQVVQMTAVDRTWLTVPGVQPRGAPV